MPSVSGIREQVYHEPIAAPIPFLIRVNENDRPLLFSDTEALEEPKKMNLALKAEWRSKCEFGDTLLSPTNERCVQLEQGQDKLPITSNIVQRRRMPCHIFHELRRFSVVKRVML